MPAQGAEVTLITELATTDITTDDLGRIDFKGVEYGRIRLQVRTPAGRR